jgi:hypothetical protein
MLCNNQYLLLSLIGLSSATLESEMQMSVIGKGWWHGQNGQGQVARCGGVASRP